MEGIFGWCCGAGRGGEEGFFCVIGEEKRRGGEEERAVGAREGGDGRFWNIERTEQNGMECTGGEYKNISAIPAPFVYAFFPSFLVVPPIFNKSSFRSLLVTIYIYTRIYTYTANLPEKKTLDVPAIYHNTAKSIEAAKVRKLSPLPELIPKPAALVTLALSAGTASAGM